ncbi:helix-turn-helix domain-containing protein, partial [uncultured Clostridium sp.]
MVGTILRNIRKIKKLKQKDIADKLNVALNTISNY